MTKYAAERSSAMTTQKLTVHYLYPEVMNTYGDRGNVQAIVRRCGWRNIETEVRESRIGEPLRAGDADLIVIGSGAESGQELIAPDISGVKGPAIREAVAAGAALLAVGGGYELLGHYCQTAEGRELAGVGLFDSWTTRVGASLAPDRTITQARAARAIGELVVRWGSELLVGFENHGGRTHLGRSAQPLGTVLAGHGNNGDGGEGAIYRNAIGTYMRGPCLPRNPVLADFLLRAALSHRYGDVALAPLPDELERAAHDVAAERALRVPPARRSRRVRIPVPARRGVHDRGRLVPGEA